ncbi:CP6K1 protein, partial [Acromyrmex charruanus]
MPYIGFYVLGKPFLLVRDRELIKNVLIKDFDYFIDRYATPNTTDRLAYSSLFFIKNPAWKILRMKLSPTFTSGKQKKMFDLMLDCGDNLDTYFESLKLEDKDIELDMKDLFSKFFIDIVGTTAYGLNVNSLNNSDNEFPKYSKQIFEVSILHAFEFLMILFLPNLIRFFINARMFNKKVTAFLRNVFWQTITQRIKSGKKRNDLIDALIKLKGTYRDQDSEREFTFDGDDLLAQAAIFFIASYETSSTTTIFTLYELARHPEVQNRLRKEILNALDETDGKITYNMVISLPYLDMVVSEILRMYPPLPFLDRITKETYKVPNSDLVLEKGTPIYISLLGMHYDPEYYPTPDKFDPERFTEENKRNRPPYVYLPFGDGPRMCIGSRMGLLQSKLGIIVILRKYEVKPCKKTLIPMNSSKMALITTYWGLDGMIILMTLIITAYLYMTRKFKYWKKRGILEITPMPFFGNFKECLFQKKAPAYFLKDIYDEMKDLPYVGFYVLDKPFLLVRDRELVKNILVKDFNYFSDRYNMADPIDRIGYANLFFIKNPAWKVVRTKLTPFFTSGKMKKMFDLMLTCVKNLDEYLDALELEGNGKTIEVRELTAKFATDIIGSTAYGLDVNSFKDPNAEFRKYGKMIFQYDTYRSFEMLAIFFLPTIVRLTRIKMFGKEPTDFMRKVFWETLTHRMKSGLKRNDLIDILLELKNNNNNDQDLKDFTFDGDDLLAQAASFFSAGFETSSTTTTFALYELAMQPEIQNTLRKEIFEALKKSNGKITYDMVWSLPYLDMVMSETLRMYPPLGYLNRVPNQTYKVPKFNLVIEKGTPVYISMLGLHYDPEYFPNPNKFDPERFNEENKRKRPPCVYFPFGEGPHACIGNRFGLLQTKLTLLKILSKCEVTLCKETLVPVVIDPRGAMTVPLNVFLDIILNINRFKLKSFLCSFFYLSTHVIFMLITLLSNKIVYIEYYIMGYRSCEMALITDCWALDGIIILTILIITAYLYMTRNFKYWKKRGVLEITPIPFMGNFMECLFLKKAPLYFLKELYDQAKDEPYVGFYILDKPILLLRDREIIKNILIKDFHIFYDRYATGNPKDRIGYSSLFLINNPAWKILRTKLSSFFSSGKLKKMFGLMLECGNHLDEYLDSLKLDGKGQIIEMMDMISKLTMDVISSTYGLNVNTFKNPNLDFFKYGKKMFTNNYLRGLEILAMFFLPNITRIASLKLFGTESTAFLRKFFWETMTKRMESGEKRYDLIDILIELKKNNHDYKIEGFEFDEDVLMAQAVSFFSAGFDTTSQPIIFTLYELALQPDIQNTLRKEIHQALNNFDGKITYDMIMSLSYMNMVISETLRKYPPLGFLNRKTMETYQIPNFNLVLEKDTPVYIPVFALHYDPEYFPNPEKFDPERFNKENKCNMPSCVYLPFGDGPHMCIGNRFALLMIKLALTKLLNKYEVTPCEKTTIPVIIDPAVALTGPLNKIIYLNMRKANTVTD